MSQIKSIALAALLGLAGLSGNANAASPNYKEPLNKPDLGPI